MTRQNAFDTVAHQPIHVIQMYTDNACKLRRAHGQKTTSTYVLLCCLLIGFNACSREMLAIGATAAVGTGAYIYSQGNLKRNYEASMDDTWKAAIESVEDLNLTIESKEHNDSNGVIKGKMTAGQSFTINLKRLDEKLTEGGVRVGTFGDRKRSEAFYDRILSHL
ncbi:MAG: DUF3568 family protein [Desulfobacterales bacterium]